MKRFSVFLLGLLALVSCDPNNGEPNDGKWQSIDCDPPLDWLEDFIPKPYEASQPQQMPALVPTASDNDYVDYAAYLYSDFLAISVHANNYITFRHHTIYPCSYSVKGWVDLQDNKIVLRENQESLWDLSHLVFAIQPLLVLPNYLTLIIIRYSSVKRIIWLISTLNLIP